MTTMIQKHHFNNITRCDTTVHTLYSHAYTHWEINYRKIIGIYRSVSDKFR